MVRMGVELNVLLQYIPQYTASPARRLIPYFPFFLIYLLIDTVLQQQKKRAVFWLV